MSRADNVLGILVFSAKLRLLLTSARMSCPNHAAAAKTERCRVSIPGIFADTARRPWLERSGQPRRCKRRRLGGTAPVGPGEHRLPRHRRPRPLRADFEATDIGKTTYFACRWVNTRFVTGPWSQIYSAIIPS